MRDQEELFSALAKSTFRQKFHLKDKDRDYLCNKGLNIILTHADDFISKRLAPAFPANDGKQPPFNLEKAVERGVIVQDIGFTVLW